MDATLTRPRFMQTYCSQCAGSFGPGESGYSHCDQHALQSTFDVAQFRRERTAAKKERALIETKRSKAKALLDGWPHSRFEGMGETWGISGWAARSKLYSLAHINPDKLLGAYALALVGGAAA